MKFSPQLNIRSAYNFQESLLRIDDYLAFAQKHNFPYAFYAENFSMFGVAEFYQKAQALGIKPIIGLTVEVNSDPLILLAKNAQGYRQLCYLSSMLLDQTLEEPKIYQEVSAFLTSDLIAVTNNQEWVSFLADKVLLEDQYFKKIYLPKISYLTPDQFPAFEVVKAIKNNLVRSQLTNLEPEHYWSDEDLSQKTNLTQQKQFCQEIADKCHFQLYSPQPLMHIVQYKTPNNLPAFSYLQKLCTEALTDFLTQQKKASTDDAYRERLDYELKVIQQMGFENYFLVVWDYVKFARDQKIMVGPGRGSAASSLVSFLLRITEVDPLEYDLLFERFLNPERLTMPDIDIDFQDDRRDEVLEYLFEKYGTYQVATIITYQTIGAKSALRDVSRIYELDLEIVNAMTKQIDFVWQNDLTGAIEHNPQLANYAQQYPTIFAVAKTLIGLPRQTGTHAAGVILTEQDLRNFLPIKIGYNGIYQTQFDMNYLEGLGLIKMDLLGLRNLTTLKIIQNNILKSHKIKLDLNQIPLTDSKTFANLAAGQTSGIFQLESPGMTKVVEKMQVASIDDISVASALFRPGPQEMIDEYIRRKNHPQQTKNFFLDPSLKPILSSTYGIIVYQEQVIQILQKVANFSLGKADVVRRAMGKKNWSYMHSAKNEFISQALENHYSEQKATEIWNWIEKFASYGFNKSHSIAYSYISYWLAYLKTYYPAEFYAALLSGVIGNSAKTSQYLQEVKQLGIIIHSPSVKNVNYNYVSTKKNLYLPLILIKGIGLEFIKKLRDEYQKDPQLFASIFTFATRMLNKGFNHTNYNALVWSGALDNFGYSRQTLINNEVVIFNFAKLNQNMEKINPALFPVLESVPTVDEVASLNEKNYLGFYISAHPLAELRTQYKSYKLLPLSLAQENLGFNQVLGMVENLRVKVDKNQQEMAFLDLIDDSGQLKVTIFGRLYSEIKNLFQVNSILIIKVKTETYKDQVSGTLLEIVKVIRY